MRLLSVNGGIATVVIASAACFINKRLRTFDARKSHAWIVSTKEPIESPLASRANGRWQLITLTNIADTTILRTTIPRTKLSWTPGGEESNSTTWNLQIKMIVSQIATSICDLHK